MKRMELLGVAVLAFIFTALPVYSQPLEPFGKIELMGGGRKGRMRLRAAGLPWKGWAFCRPRETSAFKGRSTTWADWGAESALTSRRSLPSTASRRAPFCPSSTADCGAWVSFVKGGAFLSIPGIRIACLDLTNRMSRWQNPTGKTKSAICHKRSIRVQLLSLGFSFWDARVARITRLTTSDTTLVKRPAPHCDNISSAVSRAYRRPRKRLVENYLS